MILQKIPGSVHSRVISDAWKGCTVILIGGGPSLTERQVDLAKEACLGDEFRSIAINDAYLLAPWAEVSYAADVSWFLEQERGNPKRINGRGAEESLVLWKEFQGQKASISSAGDSERKDPSVHILRNAHGAVHGFGLSENPEMLVTGRNSGFQALNLAVLAGTKKIILLGFDGQPDKAGKSHWFGSHARPTPTAAFPFYRQAMSSAEAELSRLGVEVVNCSAGSAIDSFPKKILEEAL